MSVKGYYGINIGAGPNEGTVVLANKLGLKKDGTERACLFFHGHGADALTWRMNTTGAGKFSTELAERGWVSIADDFAGGTPWANDANMTDIDAVYNFAVGNSTPFYPYCSTKVDVVGWSMGGLEALNWIKRNPAKVNRAVLWCPATELDYFHNTAPNKATYAPEIDAAYPGGAATWAGHEPNKEPTAYRGLPPIRIYHGDADTTVPLAQSQGFASAVNDPNLALHVVPGGTHTNLFGLVSVDEVADFLRGRVAA